MDPNYFEAGDLLESTGPVALMLIDCKGAQQVYFTETFFAVLSDINQYEAELLVDGELLYFPLRDENFKFKKVM